ncbi:transposase [Staphylococcus delphini]|uniref:Transposase DDE domain-containing protein n=1 Tax=Staphylococcus delphini TaxID=53344 RepID=A0AAX0QXD5_9STAP|nr:hypothetical protein B5C00_03050 [Staphylococcus delphini]PCF51632.1 hypothetical protein B5C07_03815 [Staphylococcus delphini]PNZ91046.1 hypothetical protein CD148_10975 [Staphylococcus delphini]RIZ50361.1 hypothetical protein CDL68_11510 [Staphylococcus delphini]
MGCPLRSQCMKHSTNPNTNKRLFKNLTWDYFKAFTNKQLSNSKTKHIYQKRKIDVESTFGNLKANLGFQRLSVRTQSKVECELGIALMAVNIRKLAKISARFRSLIRKKPLNSKKMNFDGFFLKELKVYVPAL